MSMQHLPVMLNEVLAALAPKAGERMVDGTFGAGGYSRALLTADQAVHVFAIDQDPEALARGAKLKAEFGDRFVLLEGRFSDMEALLAAQGISHVEGITLDVGVSSFQLETAERGFSFQLDGPLDMRMARAGETAADIIQTRSQNELADIFFQLGEEPRARKIAARIVAAREKEPITRTLQLANLIEACVGRGGKGKGKKIHPATRVFQALRIAVNDELGELSRALRAAERLLVPGGRLAIVAFHSLEDKIVKAFFAERGGRLPAGSRHMPEVQDDAPRPSFHLPKKGTIKPKAEEVSQNPRARSARLRVAIRTDAPAWEVAA